MLPNARVVTVILNYRSAKEILAYDSAPRHSTDLDSAEPPADSARLLFGSEANTGGDSQS